MILAAGPCENVSPSSNVCFVAGEQYEDRLPITVRGAISGPLFEDTDFVTQLHRGAP